MAEGAEVPEVGDQAPAGRESEDRVAVVWERGREPEGQMVWVQDRGDREVQVQADWDQALAEAAEVPEVGDQGPVAQV